MKVVLDANCFIDAVDAAKPAFQALEVIFAARHTGDIEVMVSRHTLSELSAKADAAYELAKTATVLPYWPIGTIAEQVATIEQLAGTWEDARQNERTRQALGQVAKSRSSIRDRGAYIDAVRAKVHLLVTSDRDLVDRAQQLEKEYGVPILTPQEFASRIRVRRQSTGQ